MANFKNIKKGRYKVQNLHKYIPSLATRTAKDVAIYRSSWEKYAFIMCDLDPNIVSWGSECVRVPYRYRLDPPGKFRGYYPDVYISWRLKPDAEPTNFLIEIKPKHECSEPKKRNQKDIYYKQAVATWFMNQDKWTAANNICEKGGTKFVIWSEKDIDQVRRRATNLQAKWKSAKKS